MAGIRARLALGVGLGLGLAPAYAFDLDDWTRRPIPNSPTVFYECAQPRICGDGSALSARLQPLDAAPTGIDDERRRQEGIARRLSEQFAGRIVDIRIDDTREISIEGLRAFMTEKRATFTDGRQQTYIDVVLFGPTRSYSVVASGGDSEQVRRNFEGYVKLIALMLEQVTRADEMRGAPAGPPQQQPPGQPSPQRSAPPMSPQPSPQWDAPPPQSAPPPQRSAPPPQQRPAPPPAPQSSPPRSAPPPPTSQPRPSRPASPPPSRPTPPPSNYPPPGHPQPEPQEPPGYPPQHQPLPGNAPPQETFPPQLPPANFPPPPPPPR